MLTTILPPKIGGFAGVLRLVFRSSQRRNRATTDLKTDGNLKVAKCLRIGSSVITLGVDAPLRGIPSVQDSRLKRLSVAPARDPFKTRRDAKVYQS